MREMGIDEARPKLGEIVDRARYTGQPTLITRQGLPGAVVVSKDWYELALSFIAEFRPRLGRFEIVRKDGDPANNAPDNLELRERAS